MKTFEVNGKKYNAKPFDFNMICEFEEIGVALKAGGTTTIRGYLAICSGMSLEDAGKELSEHFVKEKNLDSISKAMAEEMEKSDFFLALIEGAAEKNAEKAE